MATAHTLYAIQFGLAFYVAPRSLRVTLKFSHNTTFHRLTARHYT